MIEVRNLIFEMSDHHGLPGHAEFIYAFYKKVSYLSGSKKPKYFKVTNSPYQLLDHNSYKSGFYQKYFPIEED